jgi:GTP-binding protein Era
MWLKSVLSKIKGLFMRKKTIALALYGPPNGGKTTLANRICSDWLGEEMGETSKIAHETRRLFRKGKVRIVHEDGREILFTLVDTPGIASEINYEEFVNEGMDEILARQRAREAADGVVESIGWISEADAVVVILDSTCEPYTQVNELIVEKLNELRTPFLVVANKIDLKKGSVDRIQTAFPEHSVFGISAKYGRNINLFYEKLFELFERLN